MLSRGGRGVAMGCLTEKFSQKLVLVWMANMDAALPPVVMRSFRLL